MERKPILKVSHDCLNSLITRNKLLQERPFELAINCEWLAVFDDDRANTANQRGKGKYPDGTKFGFSSRDTRRQYTMEKFNKTMIRTCYKFIERSLLQG